MALILDLEGTISDEQVARAIAVLKEHGFVPNPRGSTFFHGTSQINIQPSEIALILNDGDGLSIEARQLIIDRFIEIYRPVGYHADLPRDEEGKYYTKIFDLRGLPFLPGRW